MGSDEDTFYNSFEITDKIFTDFKSFIEKSDFEMDGESFESDKEYLKNLIKSEIAGALFGRNGRYKIRLQKDNQLLRALELLPDAKKLSEAPAVLQEKSN